MCNWYYVRCGRPSTVVIRYRGMFLIEHRFHICCILHDTLIIAQDISWFTLGHGYTETSQLESQMLNRFQTCFQRNEFCRERDSLDCLLPLTIPCDWSSIQEDHVSSMRPSRLLVGSMRYIDICCHCNAASPRLWHAVRHLLLSISIYLREVFLSRPELSVIHIWPSFSMIGLVLRFAIVETPLGGRPHDQSTMLPILLNTPMSSWKNVTSSSFNTSVTSISGEYDANIGVSTFFVGSQRAVFLIASSTFLTAALT